MLIRYHCKLFLSAILKISSRYLSQRCPNSLLESIDFPVTFDLTYLELAHSIWYHSSLSHGRHMTCSSNAAERRLLWMYVYVGQMTLSILICFTCKRQKTISLDNTNYPLTLFLQSFENRDLFRGLHSFQVSNESDPLYLMSILRSRQVCHFLSSEQLLWIRSNYPLILQPSLFELPENLDENYMNNASIICSPFLAQLFQKQDYLEAMGISLEDAFKLLFVICFAANQFKVSSDLMNELKELSVNSPYSHPFCNTSCSFLSRLSYVHLGLFSGILINEPFPSSSVDLS